MNKKTLVLGASAKPDRYSNFVIKKLVKNDVETVAFGLKEGEVNGITIATKLLDYKNIHTVTLYLNPIHQKTYYDYIIGLNPKRVIFNPGTENAELMKLLKKHHIEFEIACSLVLLSTDQY